MNEVKLARCLPLAVVGLLLGSTPSAWAADGMIAFGVSGLKHARGHVRCALYDDADRWLEKERAHVSSAIVGSTAVCRFKGVPEGTYAIAAFHDEDDDGELDKVLGIPSEPYCFSRDARAPFGPPTFAAASFVHRGFKTVERARAR